MTASHQAAETATAQAEDLILQLKAVQQGVHCMVAVMGEQFESLEMAGNRLQQQELRIQFASACLAASCPCVVAV
jgi:hypothetical protein